MWTCLHSKKADPKIKPMKPNKQLPCTPAECVADAYKKACTLARHDSVTTAEVCAHLLGYAQALREKELRGAAVILTALASAVLHGQTEEMVKALDVGAKELGVVREGDIFD